MKVLVKPMTIVMLVAILTIVACSTPPPPVSRDNLQTTQQETIEAADMANQSMQQRKGLEAELSRKEAELNSLKDYERQLGF